MPEDLGRLSPGDVLLAIDTALMQHQAAMDSLVLARRLVERYAEAPRDDETIPEPTACPHLRRQETFGGGWVCLDCGEEHRA